MERLSFVDQIMHKAATFGMPPVNMQGAMIVDPAQGKFKVNPRILAEHIASRLGEFPILRKKLVQDPLKIGDIKLVDDPDFDVWNHITFATLPKPGDRDAFTRHLGEFSAQQLDLNRPLWRFEIIDGLAGGKIALVQKLSHATMDGLAAMKVMQSILDAGPRRPDKLKASSWRPDPEPTPLTLLGAALKEGAGRLGVHTPKALAQLSKSVANSAGRALQARRKNAAVENTSAGAKARRTSLNRAISSDKREIAFTTFELDKLKSLSKALDCSMNDLCLLLASEALVNYFQGIGEQIDFDLFVCMPMSTRVAGDREHGNALRLANINVHTTIPDLRDRLRAIQVETQQAKGARSSDLVKAAGNSQDIVASISPLVIDIAMSLLKISQPWERLPTIMNTVMSNVAGPREALFFAGMPIETQLPIIPMFHTGALAIGANSMGNHFTFGFHACGRVVKGKNMHLFVDGVDNAFVSLSAAATRAPQRRGRPATRNVKPRARATGAGRVSAGRTGKKRT